MLGPCGSNSTKHRFRIVSIVSKEFSWASPLLDQPTLRYAASAVRKEFPWTSPMLDQPTPNHATTSSTAVVKFSRLHAGVVAAGAVWTVTRSCPHHLMMMSILAVTFYPRTTGQLSLSMPRPEELCGKNARTMLAWSRLRWEAVAIP